MKIAKTPLSSFAFSLEDGARLQFYRICEEDGSRQRTQLTIVSSSARTLAFTDVELRRLGVLFEMISDRESLDPLAEGLTFNERKAREGEEE